MNNAVPPALIFILAAVAVPFLRGKVRNVWMVAVPLVAFIDLLLIGEGSYGAFTFMEQTLVLCQVDRLGLAFGYVFTLMALIGNVYALHVEDTVEQMAALAYAGSALGVVFAGDFITLFVFWELITLSAVALLFARRTESSFGAGLRYFFVHLFGGLCLLIGIAITVAQTGSVALDRMELAGIGQILVLTGIGLSCGFPLLHAWIPDAYPQGTVTGTVFLSVFTTKTAVYLLARLFPGTEALIWIGAVMAVFPIFYAVIENDLRRVLSYSLINQVGFMVVGIGVGTAMSVNGAVAHAMCHMIYQGLLFLALGGVIYQTGRTNATDLGGLYRTMPLTCAFCIVGAASISGFPLFSGFVSKSLTMSAVASEQMAVVWFALLFAAAGVFHHAGIKIPFFAFFSHDSGLRPAEPPRHMLVAMAMAAFACVFIGVVPGVLYGILPYAVDYQPYTLAHVLEQTELLIFSALAFTLLILSGLYPSELRSVNIDADWLYRKGLKGAMVSLLNGVAEAGRLLDALFHREIPSLLAKPFARKALRLTDRPVGTTIFWINVLFFCYLLTLYLW